MRVLGVDPGIARTGIAVVSGTPGRLRLEHAGCLTTEPDMGEGDRLASLMSAVDAVLDGLAPDAAAVEQLYFASNRHSALRVAQARGVVLCALARWRVAVWEYTPLQVKEAVTGYGAADKAQVARMVATLLAGTIPAGPDDVTDACAVAICHHHRARFGGCTGSGAVALSGGRRRR